MRAVRKVRDAQRFFSNWGKCAQKIVLLSKRRVLSVHKLAKECKLQSAFFPNFIYDMPRPYLS